MKRKCNSVRRIRVAFVSDDPLRVIGLRSLLESECTIEIEAASFEDLASQAACDVILLKDRPKFVLGEHLQRLKAIAPTTRVLVTGSTSDCQIVMQSLALGARGFIDSHASGQEFATAIRTVNQGLIWASRRVFAKLIDQTSGSVAGTAPNLSLTDREKEVLTMLVSGKSNKEIASPLGIEERTVKAHVGHMMKKFGVKNRIALSVRAVADSIVSA
jgi:DNA-binding NarL/FixJ family response regulator